MGELRLCPFCGAKAFEWRDNWDYYIECAKYHVDTHRVMVSAKTYEEAVERWNQRVSDNDEKYQREASFHAP